MADGDVVVAAAAAITGAFGCPDSLPNKFTWKSVRSAATLWMTGKSSSLGPLPLSYPELPEFPLGENTSFPSSSSNSGLTLRLNQQKRSD